MFKILKEVWLESRPFVGLILMLGVFYCLYEVHPYAFWAYVCYAYSRHFMEASADRLKGKS